jgi:hypothetical protein
LAKPAYAKLDEAGATTPNLRRRNRRPTVALVLAKSRIQFACCRGLTPAFAEEQAATDRVGVVAFSSKVRIQTIRQMELAMRRTLSCAVFGLALAVGAPAAQAQTIITTPSLYPSLYDVAAPPLVAAPAPTVVQPAETIETIRTVRTVRSVPVTVHRQIVTTRTITRRVVPAAPAMVAEPVAPAPAPLYNAAPPSDVTPVADFYPPPPAYDYSAPLYDTAPAAVAPAAVAPGPVVAAPAVAPPPVVAAPVVATQPFLYRYVYEPDRILVIDPVTNIAVQAIPR